LAQFRLLRADLFVCLMIIQPNLEYVRSAYSADAKKDFVNGK
jgi:hypothetical protein